MARPTPPSGPPALKAQAAPPAPLPPVPPLAPLPPRPTAARAGGWRAAWKRWGPLEIALAVSLGVHAALLGFRFVAPDAFERVFNQTTLEVILVNARGQQAPTKAQAVAQAALAGGGEQPEGRATSPLPAMHRETEGDASEDTRRRVVELQQQQQQLLAVVKRDLAALPPPDPARESGTPQERDQEDRRRQLLKLLAEIEKRISEENARPRKRYISPATREEVYAVYYDKLRRRIEERGTRDFPEHQGKKLYGELMMNLTVDDAGRLVDAEVVRGSGSTLLDRRAVAIVRAASPFGRFNTEMRRQADQIVVTSRFRFTREDGLETTMSVNATGR